MVIELLECSLAYLDLAVTGLASPDSGDARLVLAWIGLSLAGCTGARGVFRADGGMWALFVGRLTLGVMAGACSSGKARRAPRGQPERAGSACRRPNAVASCPDQGQSRARRSIVRRAWRAIRPDW